MLNLFDFKNKLGKHKLVIFVLAGVFLFGFSLSVANAKTIDIGLINDYIHIPGRIGLGVTNPSYSLTLGGAGVGLQGTSTNILSLFTNSLERLTINADGNVGIGKTNPAATLDVNGQFNVSSGTYPPLNMVRTGTQTNIIQSGAQFKGKTTADMVDGYGVDLTFAVEDSANVNNFLARVGAQRDGADNSGALVFGTRSAGTNTDHMIIKSSGNVGIGITNPSAKLTVNGTTVLGNATQITPLGGSGNTIVMADNTGTLFSAPAGSSVLPTGTSGATIRHDGTNWISNTNLFNDGTNVGIGTTAPGYKLEVAGTNNLFTIRNASDTAGTEATLGFKMTSNLSTATNYAEIGAIRGSAWNISNIVFRTGNSGALAERIRISAAGNLGIGTSDPSARLTVNGATVLGGATQISSLGGGGNLLVMTDDAGNLYSTSSSAVIPEAMPIGTSGQTIRHDGGAWVATSNLFNNGANIGIGTTAPGARLEIVDNKNHVSGDLTDTDGMLRLYNSWESDTVGKGAAILFEDNYYNGSSYFRTTRAAIKGGTAVAGNIASGFLAFYTDSSGANSMPERMRINNLGNLGIGTTNPSARLTVNGNTVLGGATQISALGGGGNLLVMADNTGTLYSTSTSAVIPEAMPIGTSGQTIRHDGGAWVANSNIFNNGTNVGIGTTNPTQLLDVNGGINAAYGSSGGYYINTNQIIMQNSGIMNFGWVSSSNRSYFQAVYSGPGNTEASIITNGYKRLTVNPDGNVGIGTTAPTSKVMIQSTTNATNIDDDSTSFLHIRNTGTIPSKMYGITFGFSDAFPIQAGIYVNAHHNTNANASLLFATRGTTGSTTERMRINSAGNVGIGITNPSAMLTVNGNTVLSGATQITPLGGTGNVLVMADNTGALYATTSSAIIPDQLWSGTKNGNIWNGDAGVGNVGIGTTSPNVKLNVVDGTPAGTYTGLYTGMVFDGSNVGEYLHIKTTDGGSLSSGIILGSGNKNWYINAKGPTSNNNFDLGYRAETADGFTPGGSTLFSLTTSGNVGIGTTNPSARLAVNGATVLGGATQISSLGGGGNLLVMADNTGTLYSTSTSAVIPEAMPIGTSGQTIRHDGGAWVANGNLFNNGTNIGIGTTNPAVKLTLRQGTTEYSQLSSAFDMAFGISSNSNLITGLDFKNSNTVGQTRLMARNNADDYIAMNAMGESATATFFGQAGNQLLLFSKGKRMAIGTHDAQPLILGANNYERMRITGAGNVGIGTTNPSYALDVSGNFRVSGVANVQSDNDQILQLRQLGLSGTAGVKDPGWNYIAFQDSEGDRQAFFGVNSAGHFVFNPEITGSKIIAYSDFIVNASSFTQTGSSAQNSFAGNLGIGTNNPTARLTVNGATLLGGATSISSLGGSGNAIVMADNTGALYTSSGMLYNRTAVSNVAYTAQAADYIIAYTSLTANRVLTLPAALCTSGKAFVITNETNSAYSVVVTPDSGRLISGQTSISLPAYNSIPVYCNGTDWFIY